MDEARPAYYAVIPADVRYDDRIPANAKLLYGEISALIGADGFCFASNQYFAKIYKMSPDSISRLIKQLEDNGYINREVERDKSGQVARRKIYLSVSMPEIHPLDNFADTPRQNCGEGIDKKVEDTNLSNTVILKENKKEKSHSKNPNLSDEEQRSLFVDWIRANLGGTQSNDAMNAVYLKLVEYRDGRIGSKSPLNTKRKINGLLADLLDGSGGDPVIMCDMLQTATRRCWLGVYPPGGKPQKQQTNEGMKRTWI